MYIDLDTGTILNGPIVSVSHKHFNNYFQGQDDMADSEVIDYGEQYGQEVGTEDTNWCRSCGRVEPVHSDWCEYR